MIEKLTQTEKQLAIRTLTYYPAGVDPGHWGSSRVFKNGIFNVILNYRHDSEVMDTG